MSTLSPQNQSQNNDSDSDNSILEHDVTNLLNFSNSQRNEQREYSFNNSQNDGFSQLLEAIKHEDEAEEDNEEEIVIQQPRSKREKLQDFNEAYTVLKSIEQAHKPSSSTSLNAFLHYKRAHKTNRRTVKGLLWPEHAQTFSDSKLLAKELLLEDLPIILEPETKPEPESASSNLDDEIYLSDDPSGDEDEMNELSSSKAKELTAPFTKMSHSTDLFDALQRTCGSIWRSWYDKVGGKGDLNEEIDPELARSISKKCSFLLEAVFETLILTRKSAVAVLNQTHKVSSASDSVPSDWKSVQRASKHILSKSGPGRTLDVFDRRLQKLFNDTNNNAN